MGQSSQGRDLVGACCGYALNVQGVWFLLKKGGDAVDDFVQRSAGAEAGEGLELIDGGDAAHHVLEAGLVGLVVWHVLDGRRTGGAEFQPESEVVNGDFVRGAEVDEFSRGTIGVHEAE